MVAVKHGAIIGGPLRFTTGVDGAVLLHHNKVEFRRPFLIPVAADPRLFIVASSIIARHLESFVKSVTRSRLLVHPWIEVTTDYGVVPIHPGFALGFLNSFGNDCLSRLILQNNIFSDVFILFFLMFGLARHVNV